MSQWADATRRLSSESSAEPGQWDTSRAEYQRGILDAFADPFTGTVVVMSSAQVGKTEVLNNVAGYFIDYDPGPMLMLQPTLEMGQTWSKDRLSPMLRDTPVIGAKVSDVKSRESGNTILHKQFPGGHLTVAGANSPASLASRPIRVLLCDEVDRYPPSAGTEGDPLSLATRRTSTFWNRKIGIVSTPTVKGFSRIEAAFLETDQRHYHVPCSACGAMQVLRWGNVVWGEKTPAAGDPTKAVLQCPHCSAFMTNAQKNAAVRRGEWVASAPFKGKAGFHLSELYSPWRTLGDVAVDFLAAKSSPERLQVWVNTSLGETWEDAGEVVHDHELQERAENYAAEVPARALYLTAGVDTQRDRLEVEVVAWGSGEESWSIDHHVVYGDPDIAEGTTGSPWHELTDYLRKKWRHESGAEVTVSHTFIDSGGSNTTAVYAYTKRHKGDRVYPIKGKGGEGLPIVGARHRTRTGKSNVPVDLFIVGTDNAKNIIMRRLRITDPGPGFCHFPAARDPEWFRQLTAEKCVTKFVKGFPRREWVKDSGRRNEALDCRVYAFAAFVMARPQLDKIAFRLKQKAAEAPARVEAKPAEPAPPEQEQEATAQDAEPPPPQIRRKAPRAQKRGGFVNSWRH